MVCSYPLTDSAKILNCLSSYPNMRFSCVCTHVHVSASCPPIGHFLVFISLSVCRLIVGLCVGVPVIILIIVAVIVLYCICTHYQNKRHLAMCRSRRRHQTQQGDSTLLAPPPYSNTNSANTTDSDLPTYTTTDPYRPVVATPTPAEREPADSGNQSCDVATAADNLPLLSN